MIGSDSINNKRLMLSKGVYAEIIPRVELLSGVLSQTSWMDEMGPNGKGNIYFRELKKYFSFHKNHDAIRIAETLTKNYFVYDAPLNFILSLKELPDLSTINGYSEYLQTRAKDKDILEKFRISLKDLYNEMDFELFVNDHTKLYNDLLQNTLEDFDASKLITWLRTFFGWTGDNFHLVFAPAMFPEGGYGVSIENKDNKKTIFEVIRELGRSEEIPQFPRGYYLEELTLHEWGHSFVNPSIYKHQDLIIKLKLGIFYNKVEKIMKEQAYSGIVTFLCEQVLRATSLLAIKDLYGIKWYNNQLKKDESKGFYLTKFTIEQLNHYRCSKKEYKTFDLFIPVLFDKYNKNREMLLRL